MNPLAKTITLGERIACNLNDQLPPMKQQPHITPASKADDKLDLSILERQEKWKSYAKRAIETKPTQDPLANGFVFGLILIGAAILGYFSYQLIGWLLKMGAPL